MRCVNDRLRGVRADVHIRRGKWREWKYLVIRIEVKMCDTIMNFVFVSIQPIDEDRNSTSVCLARELARNHRVLYVNPPVQRKEQWFGFDNPARKNSKKRPRRSADALQQLSSNLWMLDPACIMESLNWLPSTLLVKKLTLINSRRLAKAIQNAVDTIGFESFTLVIDKDIFRSFHLKKLLKPARMIYLDRDYTLGVPYWRKHGLTMEPELMQQADVVVCNSPQFVESARRFNQNSVYLRNGYDPAQFYEGVHYAEPADLSPLPRPRIMYIGAIVASRLDMGLMLYLAQQRPQYQFILIGWVDERFSSGALHRMPNVHFLGRKATREVPAFLEHVDVAINPQVSNSITEGNFPLKIVEYLAAGKPVVATATQTMTSIFSEHTRLAIDWNDFLHHIDAALEQKTISESTRSFTHQFRWDYIVKDFLKLIDSDNSKI